MSLSREDAEALARIAAALSDPGRVQLAVMLLDLGPSRPMDLEVFLRRAGTDLSQPTVSHHLRRLVAADLAGCRRRGNTTTYWLTEVGRPVVRSMLGSAR